MATAKKTPRRKATTGASRTSAKPETRARARPPASGESDAIELLTEDHRKVDELFEEYESAKEEASDGDKEELVAEICLELTVHASVEEEVFYPAAREALDEEELHLLDEAEVEHEHIKMLVEELKTMTAGEPLYDAKVKVLSEYVKHHVEEEEGEIFPTVRDADLDVEALGDQLRARKEQMMAELQVEES